MLSNVTGSNNRNQKGVNNIAPNGVGGTLGSVFRGSNRGTGKKGASVHPTDKVLKVLILFCRC